MPSKINWAEAIRPLLKKYKSRKHPLGYQNNYQLLVMVILSAQDSDRHINSLAPAFFKAFPDMAALAKATPDDLFPYIGKVRSSRKKGEWLIQIARQLKTDDNIPQTMEALTQLPGIGRKSANVIMREMGVKPEGVIVDLHVVRVAPRLGIAEGTDPKKIEQQIMEKIPQKDWGEAGMAISFLGREICRPSNPKHEVCIMNEVCKYYNELKKKN
ncbi:MAG TPA: endonuclease III [Chitinophagales bacterium]|nr:endonuclease III [Chitinophagales bacterium]